MKKILTLMVDGMGLAADNTANAISQANTPNLDNLLKTFPHCSLNASGTAVGLPEDMPSTSKIGYMTISAGQIIKQRSSYVKEFVEKDNLATNTPLKEIINHVKKHKSTIHIMGLMSDGGINSNIEDTISIINYLKEQDVDIVIDFIADGKDVEYKSVNKYVEMIENTGVPIVSVCGRYYAMDDGEKWDRTKIYYDLVRNGIGLKVKELSLALKNCYIRNITDEFLPPIITQPDKNIRDNDAIIWVNFQDSGAKQILLALTNAREINEFNAKPLVNVKSLMLYPVDSKINGTVLINEENDISDNLGTYLSKLELSQARIAAKEKYQDITYYFNGEYEKKLPKYSTYLVDVTEISNSNEAKLEDAAVTKQIIKCMERDVDFIIGSLNGIDKTSHTGNITETIKSIEFFDECLGRIIESVELNFYTLIILASHGGAEIMIDENNNVNTMHTNSKVPFIIMDNKLTLTDGNLTDVAPTILNYMDLSIPTSMKASKILIKE